MKKRADTSGKHRAYQKAERAGKLAELLICLRYVFLGYRLLHWRHRTQFWEIDLIMKRGAHLCFIEVKYRKKWVGADAPVSHKQIQRLQNAALASYHRLSPDGAYSCQFDIIIVHSPWRIIRFANHIPL